MQFVVTACVYCGNVIISSYLQVLILFFPDSNDVQFVVTACFYGGNVIISVVLFQVVGIPTAKIVLEILEESKSLCMKATSLVAEKKRNELKNKHRNTLFFAGNFVTIVSS